MIIEELHGKYILDNLMRHFLLQWSMRNIEVVDLEP